MSLWVRSPLSERGHSLALAEQRTIPFNGEVGDIVTADFNHDGVADLAIADTANKTVHVLLGKGDGTFLPQADYGLSDVATAIAMTDINRDGTADIVVGTANKQVSVLLGRPNGTFQAAKSLTLSFVPGRLLFGNLNGDGSTDMVITGQGGSTTLSVLPGNGDGTFGAGTDCTIPKLGSGASVLLEDLNGDGVFDVLLVTNNYANYLMSGIGDGAFQTPVYLSEMNGNVIAADLNGDGILDLAFVPSQGMVGIQLGRGDGTFTPPRYFPSGAVQTKPPTDGVALSSTALPIAVSDFNGDGVPDLITPEMILLGQGDGTFRQSAVDYSGNFSVVADVNADGFPDLVGAANGLPTVQYGGTVASVLLANARVRGTGTHDVRAVFTPAAGVFYTSSTSSTVQLQAHETAATTLSLKQTSPASGNASYGQTVAITANVTTSGQGTPTGNVLFAIDNTAQQQSALSASAASDLIAENLSGGPHTISASYGGDSAFAPSSTSLAITVRALLLPYFWLPRSTALTSASILRSRRMFADKAGQPNQPGRSTSWTATRVWAGRSWTTVAWHNTRSARCRPERTM